MRYNCNSSPGIHLALLETETETRPVYRVPYLTAHPFPPHTSSDEHAERDLLILRLLLQALQLETSPLLTYLVHIIPSQHVSRYFMQFGCTGEQQQRAENIIYPGALF